MAVFTVVAKIESDFVLVNTDHFKSVMDNKDPEAHV